jgi:hypothetical protein
MSEQNAVEFSEYWFDLVQSERTFLLKTDNTWDEEDFNQEYEARLMASLPDEKVPPMEAGKIKYSILRVSQAVNHNRCLFSCFDSVDDCVLKCWNALYCPEGYDFKPSVEKLLGDTAFCSDLLYIGGLDVHPPFRGKQLGLNMVRTVVQEYQSSCALAALVAVPQQDKHGKLIQELTSAESEIYCTTPEWKKAVSELGKYYARLGFKRIPRSDVYALNLDYELPELKAFES